MEQIEALTSLVSDMEKTGSEHMENDRENRSIIRDLEEVLSDTEVILRARSKPGPNYKPTLTLPVNFPLLEGHFGEGARPLPREIRVKRRFHFST